MDFLGVGCHVPAPTAGKEIDSGRATSNFSHLGKCTDPCSKTSSENSPTSLFGQGCDVKEFKEEPPRIWFCSALKLETEA